MFEKDLAESLNKIFKVKKISYAEPGPNMEQECLFIEVENSRNTIRPPKATAVVTGNAFMFCNADKLPFAFFSKAIQSAGPNLTGKFFFFEIESNSRRFLNIVQRGFSFVYFFDSQYDPDVGSIEQVEFFFEENL